MSQPNQAGLELMLPPGPVPTAPVPFAPELARGLLRDMLRIRRLEEKAAELYGAGQIRGFLHLYIGEEAVAAGAMLALQPEDTVVATYREHGQALLRGVSMRAIMAEMFGKQEGCSRGRGGSMHLFDAKARFFGGNAIVAGGLPLAVGLALADRMQGIRRVTACFFGDGAVAEGAFHESMNLAALWQLPVLFCCENNLYAMGTSLPRAQSQTDLCTKAAGYRIAARAVDGMDVVATYQAALEAADTVRAAQQPFFLEFQTYRFRAHSMFDPDLYRDKAEVEHWKEHGPIHTYTARLKTQGRLAEEQFLALDAEVGREVDDAVAFADAGHWEAVSDLLRDVHTPADGGAS
ncbi:pyruvate dehydrogenase (acetyl-transferring) E1 component subunit alpha [Pseudogulbenkiania subflava]|uniref:Pyruvate dehydrogenase E1 component subunit alpha n=1 Tax=Pseudogulbenkiania subflava DSM 22618 TaxID=1123014 RepID=A0A1Y6C8P8_9NEIS|nr:pyruvate dehydrogenase (acetyl-transferring) E1 component subunit alpha [Pseudogulbenkiania subflava]SMF49360.1 pyruvate dehydrogenase E1 component alpha subunit [Pseudogulbenkiania subflava DSM 22618]